MGHQVISWCGCREPKGGITFQSTDELHLQNVGPYLCLNHSSPHHHQVYGLLHPGSLFGYNCLLCVDQPPPQESDLLCGPSNGLVGSTFKMLALVSTSTIQAHIITRCLASSTLVACLDATASSMSINLSDKRVFSCVGLRMAW